MKCVKKETTFLITAICINGEMGESQIRLDRKNVTSLIRLRIGCKIENHLLLSGNI